MNRLADPEPIHRFFVYGTLCRGQCREKCWPVKPLDITPAWTPGSLYGRTDYPAMRPGNDRVIGECWRFAPERLDQVRTILNQIEVTNQPGVPNLYDAVIVEIYSAGSINEDEISPANRVGLAHAYHYSNSPELDGFRRIERNPGKSVRWPESRR